MMSINHIGSDEISRRKTVSDAYSDTEELTRGGVNFNARADAYRKSRDLKDLLELEKLEQDYIDDYEF